MSQIIWDDSFSVNNYEIDLQHKKWIEIYNTMDIKMSKKGAQRSDVLEALKDMGDYARYHFSFEEEYMRNINYPDFIEHRRIHKIFDNLIYNYYRKVLEGEVILGSEIINILKEWLLNHILKEDKQYALHFKTEK
jgi:hemerythrin-like metal-binding protein